jgi:putative tricarboxylic transport membrane protein
MAKVKQFVHSGHSVQVAKDAFSPTRRRGLHAAGVAAAAYMLPTAARADWKPTRPITWTLGVSPGGSVDLYARTIARSLESMGLLNGQSIVVENKPGAAGLLALQTLMRNRGDAHWLGTFHTGSIAAAAGGALKADVRDFPPVATLVEESTFAVVGAQSRFRRARDLVDVLKLDPGVLRIGVASAPGSSTHLAIAKPLRVAGVDVRGLTIVPFRSSADSMAALVGEHIDVVSATAPGIQPHREKVRALAVVSPQRASGGWFASVPTWREQGVAADYVSYNGVCLPQAVAVDQIRFWEDALRKVSESASWQDLVVKSGNRAAFRGYVDAKRYLDREWTDTLALLGELGLPRVSSS